MVMFSTEFWVVFQVTIILLLLVLLVLFIRSSRSAPEVSHQEDGMTDDSAEKIVALLEPLLKEAESTARVFERQIMEKKLLIKQLNDALDSRIISVNLLLNRADVTLAGAGHNGKNTGGVSVSELQESILSMYQDGRGPGDIAKALSVSEKEVELVVNLKKKFMALEKGG